MRGFFIPGLTSLDGSHPESTAGSGSLVPVCKRVKSYGADKLAQIHVG